MASPSSGSRNSGPPLFIVFVFDFVRFPKHPREEQRPEQQQQRCFHHGNVTTKVRSSQTIATSLFLLSVRFRTRQQQPRCGSELAARQQHGTFGIARHGAHQPSSKVHQNLLKKQTLPLDRSGMGSTSAAPVLKATLCLCCARTKNTEGRTSSSIFVFSSTSQCVGSLFLCFSFFFFPSFQIFFSRNPALLVEGRATVPSMLNMTVCWG